MTAHVFSEFAPVCVLDWFPISTGGRLNPSTPPVADLPFREVLKMYDPIIAFLTTNYGCVPLGIRPVIDKTGVLPEPYQRGHVELTCGNFPVVTSAYDANKDESSEASLLTLIPRFLKVLGGDHSVVAPNPSEKCCYHHSLRGRGEAYAGDLLSMPFENTSWYPYGMGNSANVEFIRYVNPYVAYFWHPYYNMWYQFWYPTGELRTPIDSYVLGLGSDFQFSRPGFYVGHANCSCDRIGDLLILKSTVDLHIGGTYIDPYSVDYSWTYHLTFWLGDTPRVFPPEDWAGVYPTVSFSVARDHVSLSNFGACCSLPYDLSFSIYEVIPRTGWGMRGEMSYRFSECTRSPLILDAITGNKVVNCLNDKSNSFGSRCFNLRSQFRPSLYLSSVDALSKAEKGTSTDVLQTLYKLPDASSMIPKIPEFIKACEDFLHKPFSGQSMKEIVDFASGTDLQYSFEWRPMYDLIVNQLPKIIKSICDGWSSNALIVSRGKYSYLFHEPVFADLPGTKLTARTKIVIDAGPKALLRQILFADGFGILPKPSNLWDLIPFSFVVNWLTGVGANIRKAEYGAILAFVNVYYVHSYLLESPLVADDLTPYGVHSDMIDGLTMRWYRRYVSTYLPMPTSSIFDFAMPTGSPPLFTVASLLLQLLL